VPPPDSPVAAALDGALASELASRLGSALVSGPVAERDGAASPLALVSPELVSLELVSLEPVLPPASALLAPLASEPDSLADEELLASPPAAPLASPAAAAAPVEVD
jgi:hypothetical protein